MSSNCFYHHICQWCTKEGTNCHIKMCSRCKLISYCSVEHQKLDWIIHKNLCRTVEYIQRKGCKGLFAYQGTTQEEWVRHRTQFMCSVELLGNRKLEVFEKQMILFPNVCNVCYKFNHAYYPCLDCLCAYYCCKEHLEDDKEHRKICKELKLCFDIDLFLKNGPISRSYKFMSLNKTEIFPNKIEEFIEIYLECLNIYEKILASEELSFVLTLIYSVLKKSSEDLIAIKTLRIHVIGAGQREIVMDKLMEVFFHWLPQIKHINMLLIGPECSVSPENSSQSYEFKGGNTLIISVVNDRLYHEYITETDFVPPHVAIAYNCGFSEFVEGREDTWSATIQCILNFRRVLFTVTSYNKLEADNDFKRILCNNINNSFLNIIKCAERNPFRSLRPLRDWEYTSQMFYINNFISILYVK